MYIVLCWLRSWQRQQLTTSEWHSIINSVRNIALSVHTLCVISLIKWHITNYVFWFFLALVGLVLNTFSCPTIYISSHCFFSYHYFNRL